jgi:hypothetical protein
VENDASARRTRQCTSGFSSESHQSGLTSAAVERFLDTLEASGAWSADDVFEVDIRFIETCFRKTVAFTFEHDRAHVRVADTYPGANQAPAPVVDIVGLCL